MKVFPYYDGSEQVYGDPVQIQRALTHLLGDVAKTLRQCNAEVLGEDGSVVETNPPDVVKEANDRLVAAVRVAFEMLPYDKKTGKGAVEDDCYDAINAFVAYQDQKKTRRDLPPTSSPSMEGMSSASPSINSTGCGFISIECDSSK